MSKTIMISIGPAGTFAAPEDNEYKNYSYEEQSTIRETRLRFLTSCNTLPGLLDDLIEELNMAGQEVGLCTNLGDQLLGAQIKMGYVCPTCGDDTGNCIY